MKRIVLLLACFMIACTGCAAKGQQSLETEPVTETAVETAEPETTEPEPTEPPRNLKTYHFDNAEQAENISTEDILYISSNPYYSTDFVDLEPFDFFGQELVVLEGENNYEFYEQYAVVIYQSDALLEETDVTKSLDSQQIEVIARECSHALVGDASNIATDDDEEKPGRFVSDAQYIFCGENESYNEYSIRYTELLKQERNDTIITSEMPRAYRRMYLKNILDVVDGRYRKQVLLGKLSKAYVQQQLDLLVDRINSRVIYRDVTEQADDDGNYYIYTYLHIDYSQGNFGVDATVQLTESKIFVDKETHVIDRKKNVVLNEVRLEDTAIPWPKF